MVAMSNNYWEDEDEDFDTEIDASNDGSDLLKKLRKAKRADEKRIKELTEQLETLSKGQRERLVKETLEQEGVKPSVAKYIMKDIDGEINPESIKNWLVNNGEDFGWQPNQDASSISAEDRQALRQQDQLTQGAITPDRADDLGMRIDQASTPEELARILYSQ